MSDGFKKGIYYRVREEIGGSGTDGIFDEKESGKKIPVNKWKEVGSFLSLSPSIVNAFSLTLSGI